MAAQSAKEKAAAPAQNMLWGGRFTGGLDPVFEQYNESLSHDRVLWRQDIQGSIAYARANSKCGILTAEEFSKIEAGFERVAEEWRTDTFAVKSTDEDIHTANERRLGEIIGTEVAGKLHTGRSRNDQVATDLRLWLREELKKMEGYLTDLLKAMVARAEQDVDLIMPGYTHLQKAQPVRWSHWLLSHAWSFSNDLTALRQLIKNVNQSPLGCGALSGNAFGIDRAAIAKELGFDSVLENSMHAVADRDYILSTLQWGAMLMTSHMSRWAEDLIIYSSLEFGFVRLADAYSTGSSLMPQKKNPDSLELLRGKSGRAFGQMAGLMMTVKGIPTTYNKDLQESVEPLLDHLKTVGDSLQIATGVLSTLRVNAPALHAALAPEMLATEFADYLTKRGVPFRECHHVAGRLVALAEESGVSMDKLSFEQIQGVDGRFERDVLECLDYERAVELKDAVGGTSRRRVLEQVRSLTALLGG